MRRRLALFLGLSGLLSLLLAGCGELSALLPPPVFSPSPSVSAPPAEESAPLFTLDELPPYAGLPSIILNGSQPDFSPEDKAAAPFESYSPLDELGRCGPAFAMAGPETMPTQEREPIGQVRPSGWQLAKYDFVDGKYLYNRCHLIGYQLTGENANEQNLITGTRYMNTQGMLPYENQAAAYIKETGGHVLYRSTPIYSGEDLVCSGVELEGWSVEDGGEGVCFHVYVYNVQPGVVIDYRTGESRADEGPLPTPEASPALPEPTETPEPVPTGEGEAVLPPEAAPDYVLNVSSNRFHLPSCPGVRTMSPSNRRDYRGGREELIEQGYVPCGTCKP